MRPNYDALTFSHEELCTALACLMEGNEQGISEPRLIARLMEQFPYLKVSGMDFALALRATGARGWAYQGANKRWYVINRSKRELTQTKEKL